jgi:hypothetical protein
MINLYMSPKGSGPSDVPDEYLADPDRLYAVTSKCGRSRGLRGVTRRTGR